jgi:hypothetical protein
MGCQFTIKKRRKGRRKSQGGNYFDGLGKINPSKFSILILMDWENHSRNALDLLFQSALNLLGRFSF